MCACRYCYMTWHIPPDVPCSLLTDIAESWPQAGARTFNLQFWSTAMEAEVKTTVLAYGAIFLDTGSLTLIDVCSDFLINCTKYG